MEILENNDLLIIMRKSYISLIVFLLILLISCSNKKEEKKGDNIDLNQENTSTAMVLKQAVTDIDGNTYDAVQIGDQVWMAENLRTTKYADGTVIPYADGTAIPLDASLNSTSAYRYAPGTNNNSNDENMDNVVYYGYLYNWTAVMHCSSSSESIPSGVQGICPNGWHVPSDAEWTQLTDYMKTQPNYIASGNPEHLSKALAANSGWNYSDDTDAPGYYSGTNNTTGFSALPAGCFVGDYSFFGENAYFWSATEHNDDNAYYRGLSIGNALVFRTNGNKCTGISVRCVRD